MTSSKLNWGKLYTYLIFLFLYLPIFILVIFSFNATKSRTVWSGFSFKWYIELFQDEEILTAFVTTILVSTIASILATLFGTITAIGLFNIQKSKIAKVILSINNIPMTNADIITGVSLMLLFVFSGNLLGFSLGFGTLLIAHITFNIPYVILSIMPKFKQLDSNLLEAAQDLGATTLQAYRKVIIPEIKSGIINGFLISFTLSLDDFVISYFTAGSEVSTLAMQIYAMTRKRISPEVNALSTILFVTVLTLLIVINIKSMSSKEKQ